MILLLSIPAYKCIQLRKADEDTTEPAEDETAPEPEDETAEPAEDESTEPADTTDAVDNEACLAETE